MLGLFEDLPAAPRPRMVGDDLVAIDEPGGAIIDDERDDTRRIVARYRVAIGVEVDERLRVDLDRLDAGSGCHQHVATPSRRARA